MNNIICGNCLDILPTIKDESVHLVITSPPYSTYKKYSDKKDDLGNLDILEQKPYFMKAFKEIHRVLLSGRKFILFFSDVIRHYEDGVFLVSPTYLFVPDILQFGFKIKNIFIWKKQGSFSNMKPGRGLPASPIIQSYFEYIFVFQKNGKPDYSYVNDEEKRRSLIPMKYVSTQSGVFTFANKNELKKIHPAVFPLELIQILIMLYSFVGDIVLDPFAGIGTVGEAAKTLERNYILIDINEKYCEIARKRIDNAVSIVNNIQQKIKLLRERRGQIQGGLF